VATKTEAHSARQQGDAASFTRRYTDEEIKQSEKEIAAMNRLVLLVLLFALPVFGQDPKQDDMNDCPMHAQHVAQSHHAFVASHGDRAMGFPHDKTTHHFRMAADGGAIEITVNDTGDKANTEAIRSHLKHLAMMFSDGDFSTPMFIHDSIPPGTTTMRLMKAAIHYIYDETSSGGKVRIETGDPIAVAAIHDFLRFQITEHQTGDALALPQN
jgi:hypothetical protein